MSIIQWARNGGIGDVLPNAGGWSQLAQDQPESFVDHATPENDLDAQRQQTMDLFVHALNDAALRSQDQPGVAAGAAAQSSTFSQPASDLQTSGGGVSVITPISRSAPMVGVDAIDPGSSAEDDAHERAKLNRECDATRRSDVFTESYLMGMPHAEIQGSGSKSLIDAMTVLQGERDPRSGQWRISATDQQVQDSLKAIAAARDVPLEEIRIDFEKFKNFAQTREATAIGKPGAKKDKFDETDKTEVRVPMLAMGAPGDIADNHAHMGSIAQLRFGKMIGDTLGLDPVFGALLSPTGGIAGPGNREVGRLAYGVGGDREVTVNHGIAHDAGGYLYNYHDLGPGYQYVPNMSFHVFDRGNPKAGQADGINLFYNFKNYNNPTAPRVNGEI